MEDMVKRMVVKSLYNWKTLILVLILFKLIEFYTTPFGGGFSGFPFDTFTHTSVFPVPDDFEKECNIFGIVLNLFIYYLCSVLMVSSFSLIRNYKNKP